MESSYVHSVTQTEMFMNKFMQELRVKALKFRYTIENPGRFQNDPNPNTSTTHGLIDFI